MEDYVLLFVLSLAMFLGSYVAGSLPLIVSFTESKLRLVTVIGAGLLVGTALAVIIPEGVNSIYTAQSKTEKLALEEFIMANNKGGGGDRSLIDDNKLNANFLKVKDNQPRDAHIPTLNASPSNRKTVRRVVNQSKTTPPTAGGGNRVQSIDKLADVPNNRIKKRHAIPAGDKNNDKDEQQDNNSNDVIDVKAANLHNIHHNGGHEHRHDAPHMQEIDNSKLPLHPHAHGGGGVDVHNAVGLALVAGFVLMLLIDQLAQSRMSRIDTQSGILIQPRYKITATIGLVVHAAADGVALGAASGSSHTDVQFIVFVAIMLHKAPASFGLVTFLLHEGLDKSRIRKHLLIFALAAPLAALATFFCITKGGPESLTSLHSTGVLLLFSAGTFLYVATVHVLPEVASGGGHSHGSLVSGGGQVGAGGFKLNELIALVIGAIVPTLLTVGHSH